MFTSVQFCEVSGSEQFGDRDAPQCTERNNFDHLIPRGYASQVRRHTPIQEG